MNSKWHQIIERLSVALITVMIVACKDNGQHLPDHQWVSNRVQESTKLPLDDLVYLGGVRDSILGSARIYACGKSPAVPKSFHEVKDQQAYLSVFNRVGRKLNVPIEINSASNVYLYDVPDGGKRSTESL